MVRSGIEGRERAALQTIARDFSHRSWPPAASVEYSNAARFLTGGEGVSHAADASIASQVQRNANGSNSWNTSSEYYLQFRTSQFVHFCCSSTFSLEICQVKLDQKIILIKQISLDHKKKRFYIREVERGAIHRVYALAGSPCTKHRSRLTLRYLLICMYTWRVVWEGGYVCSRATVCFVVLLARPESKRGEGLLAYVHSLSPRSLFCT